MEDYYLTFRDKAFDHAFFINTTSIIEVVLIKNTFNNKAHNGIVPFLPYMTHSTRQHIAHIQKGTDEPPW